ncbi:MAG TPA: hypothetical protein VIA62_00770 [Thermoanaerobaculia bacterium]|jgi:hypothetical protein|nr:hypothetical protein [Thermoanaerobaculia bacterium]
MNPHLSVAQILADMEAQIAHFQSREAFHAQHEAAHREQRELNAAELARVRERYDAFKTAATAAGEVVNRAGTAAAARQSEDDASLRITTLSKLIARVVEGKPEQETFGATAVAGEVNARFGKRLRRPLDPRTASVTLRRMAADGRLRLVQEGRAFHEALYALTID